MACINTAYFTCVCGKEVSVSYGFSDMSNRNAFGGSTQCECGLILNCNSLGTRVSFSLFESKDEIEDMVRYDADYDSKGRLRVNTKKESIKAIYKIAKKIAKYTDEEICLTKEQIRKTLNYDKSIVGERVIIKLKPQSLSAIYEAFENATKGIKLPESITK